MSVIDGENDPIVYLDTETFGLESEHDLFEFGAVKVFPDGRQQEVVLWLPGDHTKADPNALRINRYYSRREECSKTYGIDGQEGAWEIARFTERCTIAGCQIGFDEEKVKAYMSRYGLKHAWNVYPIDVPTYAAGALGIPNGNYNSRRVSELLGVPLPPHEERHTALGDARFALRLHRAALEFTNRRQETLTNQIASLLKSESPPISVNVAEVADRWARSILDPNKKASA